MALTVSQLVMLKDSLEHERVELNESLNLIDRSSKPVELDQNKVGRLSRMDAMQAQALAQVGEKRQKHRLALVNDALTRIDSTDFGRCTECDDWIMLGRLQIDPAALYCVKCAAQQESQA